MGIPKTVAREIVQKAARFFRDHGHQRTSMADAGMPADL